VEAKRAFRNSVYLRSFEVDQHRKRTNCCFKLPLPLGTFYGVVKRFLQVTSSPLPDAPRTVFIEALTWYESLSRDPETHLSRAKVLSSSRAKELGLSRFCLMHAIDSCTVSMAPLTADTFAVFEFHS
jgi:hypothetical protein